jgi:hypothetical protein
MMGNFFEYQAFCVASTSCTTGTCVDRVIYVLHSEAGNSMWFPYPFMASSSMYVPQHEIEAVHLLDGTNVGSVVFLQCINYCTLCGVGFMVILLLERQPRASVLSMSSLFSIYAIILT